MERGYISMMQTWVKWFNLMVFISSRLAQDYKSIETNLQLFDLKRHSVALLDWQETG